MDLYAEVHYTPGDDADRGDVTGGLDGDRETVMKQVNDVVSNYLDDASEDDEIIVTITVREE